MITPRDIHEAEFKRVWKGYSPEEVDAFLSRIVSAYESVYQENAKLREKISELEEQLEKASQSEGLVADTLAVAKQAARDLKEAAQKEAEATLREARSEAEHIVADARRQKERDERRIAELQLYMDRLKERVQSAVDDFFHRLDEGTTHHDVTSHDTVVRLGSVGAEEQL